MNTDAIRLTRPITASMIAKEGETVFNKDHFKINIQVTVTVSHQTSAAPREDKTALDHSSFIEWASYRASERTMDIKFKSGRLYRYFDVPEDVFNDLCDMVSPGGFYNSAVKGNYTCEDITMGGL